MSNDGTLKFEGGRTDLYYSLHVANIESQVTNKNGEWVVDSTVTDTYDFNPVNPQTYKGTLTTIPASQAYDDQHAGVLSSYDVRINISDRVNE